MVIDVRVANLECGLETCDKPKQENHIKAPFEFYHKDILSSTNNYSPFGKHLLTCNWILIETIFYAWP